MRMAPSNRRMYLNPAENSSTGETEVALLISPEEVSILGDAVMMFAESHAARINDDDSDDLERLHTTMSLLRIAEFAGWLTAQADNIGMWIDSEDIDHGENPTTS